MTDKNFVLRVLTLVGLVLSILSPMMAVQTPVQAQGPGDCPVGINSYHKLGEAAAPYADYLGGPDATCTNCPVQTAGIVGSAQHFDGSDDEVDVADNDQYDWGADDTFSIEFWMKDSNPAHQVIVGRQGETHPNPHWWVGSWADGNAAFCLYSGIGACLTGTGVADGTWHHIVALKDATHIRLYVDGEPRDSAEQSYSAGFDSTTALNLGYLNLPGYYRYEGDLDEVAIYDKALTATEIQQHYQKGLAGVGYCEAPEGLDYGDAPDPAYPTLLASNGARHVIVPGFFLGAGVDAEPDGQPEATASGDDNDGNDDEDGVAFLSPLELGSTVSVQVTASASGVLNAWMDFNGNGDWADVGEQIFTDASLVAGPNSLTFPVPPTATPGQTFSRFRFSTVGGLSYDGLAPDGEVEDYLVEIEAPPELGSITIEKVTDPPGGTGFEFTGTGGLGNFSLDDGQNQAFTGLTAGDYDVTETTVPSGWELADVTCTGGSTTPITDGVTIHLAASEAITCTFTNQLGAPPTCSVEMISYHKLEESAAPYADSLGGADATCTNCPVQTTGIVGSAQQFDGIDDEVDVPDNGQYEWDAGDEFSIEYWMRSTSGCGGNEVIVGRDDASTSLHWWTGCADSGDQALFVLLDKNGGNGGNGNWPYSGTDITDGDWHHLVFVKDATHIRVYMDGQEKDSVAKTYTAGFDGAVPLNIGYLNLGGHYRYEGDLDEVAIYDRALTATEIQEHHNRGRVGWVYCTPPAIAPTIVSSAVTQASVGCLYTYDVDASGNPPPTYTLTTKPTGMTIDENTGLISWTPDAAGDYDVTVEAHNSAGTDSQSFTLEVGTCPCGMTNYWKLDESGTPTSFQDAYGADDGVCSSHGCPTPADGQVNGGQAIDGGSTGVGIDIPAHPSKDAPFDWGKDDSFSVEFWMKRSGTISENDVIIGRDEEGAGASSLHWWCGVKKSTGVPDGNLVATNGDGAGFTGSTNVNDGNWHHLVFVRDAAEGKNLTYVDGVLDGSVDKASYSAGFDSATAAVNIGWLSLDTKYTYDGLVDEVAFYSKALSLSEVQEHYQKGLAGVGYCEALPELGSITIEKVTDPPGGTGFAFSGDLGSFTLDDGQSTVSDTLPAGDYTVTETVSPGWNPPSVVCVGGDSTPVLDGVTVHLDAGEHVTCTFTNEEIVVPTCPVEMISYHKLDEASAPYADYLGGPDANCTNCPTAATGLVNGAQQFDGADDEVDVPDNDQYDWAADDSFTIEYWMQKSTPCTGNEVIVGRDDDSTTLHWWTGCQEDGTVRFQLRDVNGNGPYLGGTGDPINDGEWHHLVFVRDEANNENRIYVDGVETHQGTHDYTAGFGSSVPLNVGYLNLSGHYRYDGLLDEVALYDRALTDAEILQHYNAGVAGLAYCERPPEAPTITSSPDTQAYVGVPYSYDVEATGYPAPTYTLTVAPAGMTIDELTGEIGWTPTATGDYDVVVEAHNTEGVDQQSFVLSVSEPPPFALRINCGGSTVVDGDITWESSDPYVTGGANYIFTTSSVDTTTNSIEEPIPPLEVYKACRHQSPHTYSFPSVPNGDYIVRIHWIDQVASAGLREIDYDIEGVRVEEDWDVYAEAGGTFVAIDKEYEMTVSDGNGLQITSSADSGDAFESAIEITIRQDEAPTITSEPVMQATVGIPYSYDVEATGYPVPTYTLTVAPAGMTIDESTGEIAWTPTTTGDYDVTVQASNGVTPDATQSFTIHVAAITPCPLDMSAYWRLDETSSGSYVDSFGDNDGLCRATGNCPAPAANGKVNRAQEFSRASQLGIDIPVPGGGQDAPFDWGQNDSFSIEFWMKRDGPINGSQISDNEVIIGRDDPNTNLHWWFGMWYDGTAHFQLGDKTGDSVSVDGPAIDDGRWHHLVGVRDAVNGINYLYVDGVQYSMPKPSYSGGFDSPTAALNLGWLNLDPGYYYTGLLDEVALYDRALTAKEVKTYYYLARGYCEACESAIDIMPLGDSITVGNASGVVPDDEAHWVSYRKDLWESLGAAGYDVDFVGGQSHGYAFDPPFDSDHEGHGGWTDSQIRDNVVSFLTANPADVVLLHIGTNGLSSDPDQVEEILDNIDSVSEDITVVLARIINRRDGSTTTTQFNDNVEAMALARMDPTSPDYTGDKIIIVDMEIGAGIVYGQAPSNGDMWDNLHPYETGYAKMANVWLHGDSHGSDGLEDFLSICAPPTPYAPTITSDPVTEAYVGWPYSYDVEADGYPAPIFALTEYPSGMTVDAATGLIEWTPTATGDYDVTVQASNGVTPDATQSFTIHVAEAPACPIDMISYWKLDESAAPYADYLGGPDATCSNCPSAVAGTVGEAQQFDGSDDAVNVPDNDQFEWSSSASFSIEYWMKKDGPAHQVIVGRDDGGTGGTGTHWWVGTWGDGYAAFVLIATDGSGSGSTNFLHGTKTYLADNEWYHVVAVRDATSGQNRIYIDGELEQEKSVAYTAGFNAGTDLNIGYMAYHGSPGYHYGGALDEVAIYDRVLSLDEIQQHHQAGLAGQGYCEIGPVAPEITSSPVTQAYVGVPYSYDVEATGSPVPTYTLTVAPLGMDIDEVTGEITWMPTTTGTEDVTVVAVNSEGSDPQSFTITVNEAPVCPADMISYWKLDETAAPYADYLGGPDATCSNCPSAVAGTVGGAQQFDGSDDEVNVVDNDQYDWGATDEFSIEYWMRSTSNCSGNEVIVGRQGPTHPNPHWWTGCADSGDQAVFVLFDKNGGNGGNGNWPYSGTDITDGDWHHLVFVKDATHIRVYVDGQEKDSVAKSYTAGFDSTTDLNIGYLNLSGHYRYEGDLDEVAIYDKALTLTEIQQHYNAGLAGQGYCEAPPEPGILGDVNGDDTVNSTDALIILSCDVGIDTSPFCPMNCGDVNGDGWINSTDALVILSYDVDIDVPYPVGQPGCPSSVTPCPGCNP